MEKVDNHSSFTRIILLSLAFMATTLGSFAQDAPVATPTAVTTPATPAPEAATASPASAGDPIKGKELFNSNCAACHKLDAKSTGPALRAVAAKHDQAWLYKWIHNSSEMIKAGDPVAVKLFEENGRSVMTPFPQLSNGDIDNIIAYTSQPKAEPVVNAGTSGPPGTAASAGGVSNDLVLGILSVVLVILILMLVMVNRVLNKIANANGVELVEKEATMPIWRAYAKNQFLVLVTVIFLMLASAYFVYGWLMQVGVDKDYAPIQPIHYSHRIHAGDNGIDCKYCHSAARVSKNAGIPSLNICMNCHKNISEVAESTATPEYSKAYYDGEIAKLYNAIGWDKAAQKYTGVTRPVKWIRIHNLPDFVYFNHSQHVTVAGIDCQTCHGPVESYEIQKQFAPLTMGWCINCHRKTNVKMEGNEYYAKIHAELSKKYNVDKLTEAQMGGLECGKCHY